MDTHPDSLFLPALPIGYPSRQPVIPWMRWGEGGGLTVSHAALLSRDHLFLCDNLDLLNLMPDGCVDLVYIDPPFGTGKRRESPQAGNGIEGYDDAISDPEEFIQWLAPRLSGLWRVLKADGNLVIHLDPRAVHHVRVWCDARFGADRWENEIIWHYTGGGRSKTRLSRKHDVLLWYSRGPGRVFNIESIREPYKPTSGYAKGGITSRKGKKYMPNPHGTPADDVWEIPITNPMSSERTPYPTQKPVRLLDRVVSALSSPGDVVCDIFCGSGTTAVASRNLGRSFICCDINPDAMWVALKRLSSLKTESPMPALISRGIYRLTWTSPEMTERAAEAFCKGALGIETDPRIEIVKPSWSIESEPPAPLTFFDTILKVGCPS